MLHQHTCYIFYLEMYKFLHGTTSTILTCTCTTLKCSACTFTLLEHCYSKYGDLIGRWMASIFCRFACHGLADLFINPTSLTEYMCKPYTVMQCYIKTSAHRGSDTEAVRYTRPLIWPQEWASHWTSHHSIANGMFNNHLQWPSLVTGSIAITQKLS